MATKAERGPRRVYGCFTSALKSRHGDALDEVLLGRQVDDHHRDEGDDVSGHQHRPVGTVLGVEQLQPHRHGELIGAVDHDQRPKEGVPYPHEAQGCDHRERRLGQGQDDPEEDGAGYLAVFLRIILPLSKPALAVVAALGFMGVWNSFLWPLIMINSTNKFTVPVGLQLLNSQHGTDWTVLMAGDVIALIPVVIVYLAAQKHFIQGITMTGLKG